MITVEKCCCGHPGCHDWWLVGIGKFVQGSGFDRDEAVRIARLLNEDAKRGQTPVSVCDGAMDYGKRPCRAVRLANGDVLGETCGEPCSWMMGKSGHGIDL